MTKQIVAMLTQAYARLGITDTSQIQPWVRQALHYFNDDRERYIEVVEPDVPEYLITVNHGVICKLIPLARSVTTEQDEKYTKQNTTVFALMVSEDEIRYVWRCHTDYLAANPADNSYRFPIYRYATLDEIKGDLHVLPPYQITPVATPHQLEIYKMIFLAMAKFCGHMSINHIPHKTERAMLAIGYSMAQAVTVSHQPLQGKLVTLATGKNAKTQIRKDHRYTCTKDLCLFVMEQRAYYLLKTWHQYHYFRKIVFSDTPGDCAYEPTEDKQEICYEIVKLEDLDTDFSPNFY